ncbi:MAG: efflux RND transporter periplasmic adaptor subunit [Opitutaceae bacterium]|jgi:RND family efflux transporter MFP subunit
MIAFIRPFAFACAILALGTACRQPAPPVEVRPSPISVKCELVRSSTRVRTQLVAGTVRPVDHAVVSAKIMGTVSKADFAVGRRVVAGEPLVMLAADEIGARLAQAQAALDGVKGDLERETGLLAKGASTAESVRSLADRRRGAEASVQEAKTLLGYTRVTAPFAGVIARRFVQEGDLATAGTPLFSIEGLSGLRAEVEVPASLPLLVVGTVLRVEIPGGEVDGTLGELSAAADLQTRTRLAKVTLPADMSAVHSGDFVRVVWPAGEVAAITVPAEAVSVFGQMERVFVVEQGRARLRLVKTAGQSDGRVRVAAGLDANETVILNPSVALRDGQPVEVQP